MKTKKIDAFGETVDNYSVHDMFTTTDTGIERQFQIADVKLGREGIGMAYGNRYMDMSDLTALSLMVILSASIIFACQKLCRFLMRLMVRNTEIIFLSVKRLELQN